MKSTYESTLESFSWGPYSGTASDSTVLSARIRYNQRAATATFDVEKTEPSKVEGKIGGRDGARQKISFILNAIQNYRVDGGSKKLVGAPPRLLLQSCLHHEG